MIPKKSKDLIREYSNSSKGDIPLEDLENIIEEYYRQIKNKASELEYWNIRIRGIGDLRSSYKKVSSAYFKYLTQKKTYQKDQKSAFYKEACLKLSKLSKIMKSFYEERKKEEMVKKKKIEFFYNKNKKK